MQTTSTSAAKNIPWIAYVLIASLLFLVWCSLEAGKPTPALAVDANLSVFSAGRAMPHLFQIAQQPHPVGTPENGRVRAYLMGELRALGLEPQVQNAFGVFKSKRGFSAGQVQNILVRLPGKALDRASRKALLLSAHYDSVPHGPGAGDDGASVAAILETLRALKNNPALSNDLICIFTDGEEVGLLGAEAFVAEHPWAREVGLALNFEYRGNSGAMLMFETSPGNGALIAGMAQSVAHPVANSLNYEIYKLLPNDTDLSAFKRAGIAGLNFSAIEGHTSYHTALDKPELLDRASLQHQGEIMLSLVRHFGARDLTQLQSADRVYFDFPGLGLVHYPVSAVWPITLVIAGLFLAVGALGIRRKQLRPGRLAWGALLFLVILAALAGGAQGLWQGVLQLHPGYALMQQGETYNSHWYLLAFVGLTLGLFALLQRALLRWLAPLELALASLLIWLSLLLASSALMPGASFLLAWPMLAMLLVIAALLLWPNLEFAARASLLLLGAAPAVLLFAPLLRAVFIGLGPSMLFVMVAVLVLLLGLLAKLLALMPRSLPLSALGLALVFFLIAAATSGFDARHPQPSNLFYLKDGQTGRAYWISGDKKPDAWTRNFFPGVTQRQTLPALFGENAELVWASPAPETGLSAPHISVLEERSMGARRLLKIEVKSPRAAPTFLVTVEGVAVLHSSLNARVLSATSRTDWSLRVSGVQDAAVRLDLELAAGKAFRIRVRERSFGLPANSMPLRPAGIMAQPFGSADSSQSVTVLEWKSE